MMPVRSAPVVSAIGWMSESMRVPRRPPQLTSMTAIRSAFGRAAASAFSCVFAAKVPRLAAVLGGGNGMSGTLQRLLDGGLLQRMYWDQTYLDCW